MPSPEFSRSRATHLTLRALGAGANIAWRIVGNFHRTPAKRTRVAVIHDEHLLVIQNITNFRNWTLPGGGYYRSETPAECAARELREELGIDLSPEQLVPAGEHSDHPYRFDTFVATISERPDLQLSWEIAHAKWVPVAELPENISPFIKLMLQQGSSS